MLVHIKFSAHFRCSSTIHHCYCGFRSESSFSLHFLTSSILLCIILKLVCIKCILIILPISSPLYSLRDFVKSCVIPFLHTTWQFENKAVFKIFYHSIFHVCPILHTLSFSLPFLSLVLELVMQKPHLFYLFYFKSLFSTGDWYTWSWCYSQTSLPSRSIFWYRKAK